MDPGFCAARSPRVTSARAECSEEPGIHKTRHPGAERSEEPGIHFAFPPCTHYKCRNALWIADNADATMSAMTVHSRKCEVRNA